MHYLQYGLLSTNHSGSWFTYLEQTPLNRCQQLLVPYKRLIDDTIIEQDRQSMDKILDLSTELIR